MGLLEGKFAAIALAWAACLSCAPAPTARSTAGASPSPTAVPPTDSDNDGIWGVEDECPYGPETYNGVLDSDGCVDTNLSIFSGHVSIASDVVRFDYNSDRVLPESLAGLDLVALTLRNNARLQLVQIEVHSDERGTSSYNVDLTDARAKSVMDLLVARGVPAKRLRAKGFGPYCPLDPAHNEAAWAKNRRTIFRIAKYDGRKDYDELGCANATANGIVSLPVP